MAYTFSELVHQATEKAEKPVSDIVLADGKKITVDEFFTNVELLNNMMVTNGSYRGPRLSMQETLRSPDASILFPKVISDVLIRPKEPLMIGQNLLAKTVQVDNVKSVEFPTMGAIRAFEIPETGEYKEQVAAWTEHIVDIKVKKYGLRIALSDDIIRESMWDVLALHVEAAGYAMLRKKEQLIFEEFQAHGHKVFDNNNASSNAWTTGKSSAQTNNFSATFDDFIDAMGALISHEYIPTDIIMHPLAWAVFHKDPIIRNLMYTQSSLGQTVWTSKPDFDQSVNLPWNMNYQVSPFVPMTISGTLTTGAGSGLTACPITDVYIVDRNHSVVVLQSMAMETEEWDTPERDVKNMKVREKYGVGTLNGGRSSAVISNIRVDTNYAPQGAHYAVTPA